MISKSIKATNKVLIVLLTPTDKKTNVIEKPTCGQARSNIELECQGLNALYMQLQTGQMGASISQLHLGIPSIYNRNQFSELIWVYRKKRNVSRFTNQKKQVLDNFYNLCIDLVKVKVSQKKDPSYCGNGTMGKRDLIVHGRSTRTRSWEYSEGPSVSKEQTFLLWQWNNREKRSNGTWKVNMDEKQEVKCQSTSTGFQYR